MKERNKIRHIFGYFVGSLFFVVILPSLIYLIAQIDHPVLDISITNSNVVRYLISIPLLTVGLVFAIWSNIDLFRVGGGGPTDVFNVAVSPRTKKLVTTGPYRLTRNPMVFGVNSMYFGTAVLLNSLASLIFCGIWLSIIIGYLKRTEERRLLEDFGEEYLDYKRKVSMIVPFQFLKRKLRR